MNPLKPTSLIAVLLLTAMLSPGAASATAPTPISVTPDNLEQLLFSGNIDVAREMNNVMRAKNNVDIAFGNVLPSLSLNVGVAVASPPLFLLSSVSCLVPFLFPSTWQGLRAAQKEARAEAKALEITKLNAYALAFSLFTRFSYDEQILAVLGEQYKRLEEYAQTLRDHAGDSQLAGLDALRGELELRKMDLDVSRVSETIGVERAALRKMLGLGIEQGFEVNLPGEQPAALEDAPQTQALVDTLFARAPERAQLDLLLAGAENRVNATFWAFLAGCSGSQGSWGPSTSNSFTVSSTFSLSIGYGNFPAISLSKRNVEDLKIRRGDLQLELARVLESTQKSIAELKQRLDDAARSVEIGSRIMTEQRQLAEHGQASRKEILDTANGIARSKIELLNDKTAIDGHRITLMRLGLEGKFGDVLAHARLQFEPAPGAHRSGD